MASPSDPPQVIQDPPLVINQDSVSSPPLNVECTPTVFLQKHMPNINIEVFRGDPDTLHWFISQIDSLKLAFQWSDPYTLLFLKSKLADSALKYFSSSPACLAAETYAQAVQLLKEFFLPPPSQASALAELKTIKLSHNESIKNLGHRIQVLGSQAYPEIPSAPKDKLLNIHFLNALPDYIRQKLILDDDLDFSSLLKKAQKFQEAEVNYNLTSQGSANMQTTQFQVLTDTIHALSLKVQELSLHQTHHLSAQPAPQDNTPSAASSNKPQNIICLFCGKPGHVVVNCFLYKKQNFKPPREYNNNNRSRQANNFNRDHRHNYDRTYNNRRDNLNS